MPDARRLRMLARRRLADWAYWCAMSRLARGHRSTAQDIFKFAIKRFPSMVLVPPFGYIWRMEDPRSRFTEILVDAGRNFFPSTRQS